MDLQCEHCGGGWSTSEDAGPVEMICPACHTVPSPRRLRVFQAARAERLLARDKVMALLVLQNNVLKKRSHPPDATSAASLKSLELEVLLRAAPPAPIVRTLAPCDEGELATVIVRPDTPVPAAADSSRDVASVTLSASPSAALLAASAVSEAAPINEGDRVTLPAPAGLSTDLDDEAPTLARRVAEVILVASRPSTAPPRPGATGSATLRGARVSTRTLNDEIEEAFDLAANVAREHAAKDHDAAPIPLLVQRSSAPPSSTRIPLRRDTPPPSSGKIPTHVDGESLSPLALDETATVLSRRFPETAKTPSVTPARHMTSALLAASALVVLVIYGGVARDRAPSMTASAAAPFESRESATLATVPLASVSRTPDVPVVTALEIDSPADSTPHAKEAAIIDPSEAPVVAASRPARTAASPSSPPVTDSEALESLGDQALEHADYPRALALYGQILATNPRYLPARLSIADIRWTTGDLAMARASYARILSEFPPAIVPDRARARAVSVEATSPPIHR